MLKSIIKANANYIIITALCSIIIGTIPAFIAFNFEKLISLKNCNQYIITYSLIIGQTSLQKIQEFQLQQLKAKLYPKVLTKLSNISNNSHKNQENINTIALFVSNLWPACFILKNISLMLSLCVIIAHTKSNNLTAWLCLMVCALIIAICKPPNTKELSIIRQTIQNKMLAKTPKNKLAAACTQVSQIINLIIFRQQLVKSILINCILIYLIYLNWRMFIHKQTSLSQTIMFSSITINMTEVIWWLQHELSIWQVQVQRFKCALKQSQL